MNKLTGIVVFIAAICVISGGYAFLVGNNVDVAGASSGVKNNDLVDSISDLNENTILADMIGEAVENSHVSDLNALNGNLDVSCGLNETTNDAKYVYYYDEEGRFFLDVNEIKGGYITVDGATGNYITGTRLPNTNLYVVENVDYTDKYDICALCKGFLPVGKVTKPLPDFCHICPGEGSNISGLVHSSTLLTREEAVKFASSENYESDYQNFNSPDGEIHVEPEVTETPSYESVDNSNVNPEDYFFVSA